MRRFARRVVVAFGLIVLAGLVTSTVPVTPAVGFGPRESAAGGGSVPVTMSGVSPVSPSAASPFAGMVEVAPAYSGSTGVASVGPLPSTTSVTVAVGLAGNNGSSLPGLVSAMYVPGTSEFHSFRTASQLAASFGPSESTISAAESYFELRGVSVALSPDHLLLFVTGPSNKVAAAFGTTFQEYRAPDGQTFFSHPTAATLPESLPWSGVYGLGNATAIVPAASAAPAVETPVTPAAGCEGSSSALIPCQIWQAYNMTTLISTGTNGSGVQLAVVDAYSSGESQSRLTSDLASFAAENGLPVGPVNFLYPVPGSGNLNQSTNTEWSLEDALDFEWARAAAPGATIDMTFSPNAGVGLYEAVDWLVAHQAADVISLSWGEPDVGVFNAFSTPCSVACNASSDGSYGILSPVLAFAAAEGISVFAASGDCGSSDGTSGVATNFPASDPDVTGVGGTVLDVDPNGTYVSEVGWSGNASGAHSPGCTNQGGSGGGYSPFPRPSWQTGLPNGVTHRGVPDVALDAGTPVTLVQAGLNTGVIGTSVATPIWAGIASIADQEAGEPLGLLDPTLYAIAAGPNDSRDFHDITSGSNGYPAGVGWDPVTGLGTPRVDSLVGDLIHPVTVRSSNLSAFVYATPRFGAAPLTVTFRVNATGGTGQYPLEGVSFGNGNASFVIDGTTSYTFVNPGVYSAQAYVADSAANYSVSPPVMIVVGGGGSLNVSLTASTESPARDVPVLFSVSATGGVAPYQYNYSFGDGTFLDGSSESAVNHTFGAAGSFCAEVVVSDSASPVNGGASARVAIGVGGAPRPDCGNDTQPLWIDVDTDLGVRDAPADFAISPFSAGGGSSSVSLLAPSVQLTSTDPYIAACQCGIFRFAGTYRWTATATDSENEEANASLNVTVAPPLVGNFSASATFGVAPLTVTFRSSVSGGVNASAAATNWSFGDGHGAEGASVSETYSSPGFYLAVGHVSDHGEGNASEAFLIDVSPPASSDGSPASYLTATISPAVDVSIGASVNYSAHLVSTSGEEIPAAYGWHIGPVSTVGFGAYRPTMNWTFNGLGLVANGTLELSLSATALSNGEELASYLELPSFAATVTYPGVGAYYPRVDALDLSAGAVSLTEAAGNPWNASGTVSGPEVAPIAWAFGDGTEATVALVNHTFADGLFTVVATASDRWGDTASISFPVEVSSVPVLDASVSPSTGTPPLSVAFRATMTGGVGPPNWYSWTFGNGENSSVPNGTVTFSSAGTYRVYLNVSELGGIRAVQTWTITVANAPSGFVTVLLLSASAAVGAAFAVLVAVRRDRPRLGAPLTP